MAINQNRPVISYENIALLQSDVSAYSEPSNSGANISFLPLVQSIDVSVDFQRNNAGQIGSKNFANQSFQNALDVNLTINTFEDFGNLFSCLSTGNIIREDLDLDRNFYAILGDRRSFDISKQSIRGKQVLSFGNCFLQSVSMSQTAAGLIQSSYNFVASNLQASQIEDRIIYFNDYEHLDVGLITNTTETLSDDLGIITITEDDSGGNDSIVGGGVFGPGTKSLRMWDNASSLEYNHIYSGVPENGNYLVSGTFITNNGGSLLIKTKSGIANTTVFNGASTQPSSFLGSGYVTTDGFITISRIGDGDGDIESLYISDLTIRNLNNKYEINCPAIELTGSQQQNIVSYFDEIDSYYSSDSDGIIPYYSTNVLISGSGSFGNFLMNSESIQSFDLNLPINRKTIYSLGKKYPVKRKALFPSEGSFSFTNKTDDFYVNGERANLNDFLNYDEFYTIFISGSSDADEDFVYQIQSGKLNSMNLSNSIGSNTENSLSFSFELNRFNK